MMVINTASLTHLNQNYWGKYPVSILDILVNHTSQSHKSRWIKAHHSKINCFLLRHLMSYSYVLGHSWKINETKESFKEIMDSTETQSKNKATGVCHCMEIGAEIYRFHFFHKMKTMLNVCPHPSECGLYTMLDLMSYKDACCTVLEHKNVIFIISEI